MVKCPTYFAELPGAPEQVDLISSDYEFVVLRLQLSAVGTTPLTAVGVEFHSPYLDSANVSHLQLYPGHSVEVTVLDLEEDTEYTVTLAVFNYGGKGMPSQHITFTTSKNDATHGRTIRQIIGSWLIRHPVCMTGYLITVDWISYNCAVMKNTFVSWTSKSILRGQLLMQHS